MQDKNTPSKPTGDGTDSGKGNGGSDGSSGSKEGGDNGGNDGGGSGNSSSSDSGSDHGTGIGESLSISWDSFVTWITQNGVEILSATIVGIGIYFALLYSRRTARNIVKKVDPDASSGVSKVFAGVVDSTWRTWMALTAAIIVISYTNPPDGIYNLVDTAFFIVTAYQTAIWVRELIIGIIEIRRKNVDEEQAQSLKSAMTLLRLIINVVVFSIATIVVLDNLGVNVTGLLAGLGIGGVAMGLAAKGIFSDLFAALSILLNEPFKRGDTIFYDKTKGTVKQIGLQTTRIRSENGEIKIISNANLLDMEITNKSEREFRREVIILRLVYQTTPALAADIPDMLKKIVESCDGTFSHAGFINFSESSIDYELEFFSAKDGEEGFQIRHKVGVAIMEKFAKVGIKFAYPTQTQFTAAPDGQLIMPYPDSQSSTTPKPAAKPKAK